MLAKHILKSLQGCNLLLLRFVDLDSLLLSNDQKLRNYRVSK